MSDNFKPKETYIFLNRHQTAKKILNHSIAAVEEQEITLRLYDLLLILIILVMLVKEFLFCKVKTVMLDVRA